MEMYYRNISYGFMFGVTSTVTAETVRLDLPKKGLQ